MAGRHRADVEGALETGLAGPANVPAAMATRALEPKLPPEAMKVAEKAKRELRPYVEDAEIVELKRQAAARELLRTWESEHGQISAEELQSLEAERPT